MKELMRKIEKEEEQLAYEDPDRKVMMIMIMMMMMMMMMMKVFHLCIVNLVIGTLYCAKEWVTILPEISILLQNSLIFVIYFYHERDKKPSLLNKENL